MHLALHPQHPVHALDHVHRDADRAGLVGDRAGDRLADPPRGVRRELEALGVVELVDRPHQAEVALLDEVEELHAPTAVALGDADTTRRRLAWISSLLARCPRWTTRISGASRRGSIDPSRSSMRSAAQVAVLDGLREPPLVVAGEQVDPADLAEVHAHGVGGHAARPAARPLAPAAPAPASRCSSAVLGRRRPASRPARRRRRRRRSASSTSSRRCAMPRVGELVAAPSSSTSPVSSTSRSTCATSSAWTLRLLAPASTSRRSTRPASTPWERRRRCRACGQTWSSGTSCPHSRVLVPSLQPP